MKLTIILLSISIIALSTSVWILNIQNNEITQNLETQQGKNFWFQGKIEDLYEKNKETNKELYKNEISKSRHTISKAGLDDQSWKFHSIVEWQVVLIHEYTDRYIKVDIYNNIITSNYQP